MKTLSLNIELLPIHKNLQEIAQEQFRKYSLEVNGWKFEWEKSKKHLGRCYFHQKVITMSIYWVLYLPETESKDTILHEVAHALTWQRYEKDKWEVPTTLWKKMSKDYLGHGFIWQTFCKQVGAKPQKCYDGEIRLPQVK